MRGPSFYSDDPLMHARSALILVATSVTLVLLTLTAYWPGLDGVFLFDDFANLPALGANGPVDNWPAFWRYITSGTADPTGRPLTLLTFLLDANNWPADAYTFKRTNLILHLLNGALLFALLASLGKALELEAPRYRTAALLGTALWLLHPLLVSTTLYIVQREAMLPATLVLAGLLTWMRGRRHFVDGNVAGGLAFSVAGLGGFTVLAVLAKANGVLLPLYALLIEYLILAPRQPMPANAGARAYRLLLFVLAVVPAVALCLYLLWAAVQGITMHDTGVRSWTIGQRLLTEPRVLLDYLSLLWVPRPLSTGLFNDQYMASVSLFRPLSTLPSLLGVCALIGGAWLLRRRQPALTLAVLFYFAGHLVESTSLGLELYFEHRNYVPALGMFWPLGLWLADSRSLRVLKGALIVLLPIGLAVMTHARAQVWGNTNTQDLVWARLNPESPRAQTNAALFEMQNGRAANAAQRLEVLLARQPDQAQLAFTLLSARCLTEGVRPADVAAASTAMARTGNTGTFFTRWFDDNLPIAVSGSCPGLTLDLLRDLLDIGLHNPKLSTPTPRQDLLYLRGRVGLAASEPEAASTDFTRALDVQPLPAVALRGAAELGSAGNPVQGERLLEHYEQIKKDATPAALGMPTVHEWVLARQNYWSNELAHLRRQLQLDAATAPADTAKSDGDPSKRR